MPSIFLQIISGEFKGIISDLLVLEAGAQVGTEVIKSPNGTYKVVEKKYNWDNIHHLFVNSQALDPYFQHTYVLAQGLLPWEPGMINETQAILQTAAQSLPWDWKPLHFMGFNYYYFLNNPGKAGKIFLEAAQIKNAPSFLAILGARLAQKGDETATAIILLKSVLAGKNKTDPSYTDIEKRLQALEGSLIIEQGVNNYRNRFNKYPTSLKDLLDTAILKRIPPNPYNQSYCIGKDGTIHFDAPDCQTH